MNKDLLAAVNTLSHFSGFDKSISHRKGFSTTTNQQPSNTKSPAAVQMLVMSPTGPNSVQFTQMPNGLSQN